MTASVKLAEYLFARLRQLGVRSVYGVPGDYNLTLLDYVEPAGLHWAGNCNELNAGYAADGYSRIKGLGALITTFGVGELSAINAIAGAFVEKAPVVHIVGTPERPAQESRLLVHHTLNDGEYQHFAQMHLNITAAHTNLTDPRISAAQIDWVLEQCLRHSRPVYIQIPADMVDIPIPSANLNSIITTPSLGRPNIEKLAMSYVLDRIYTCKRPMILVDGETRAFDIVGEVNNIVKAIQWPTWTTVFGKGLVDETLPNVHGIYLGRFANEEVKRFVRSCDLVLCFGPHNSSTNTSHFSSIPDHAVTISFTATAVKAGTNTFRDQPAKYFLTKLLENIDYSKITARIPDDELEALREDEEPATWLSESDPVNHRHIWRRISKFLLPGDIILAETGTAGHGSREFSLPQHTRYFSPVTWLSIGYMLPAALGAAMAQRELVHEDKWNSIDQPRVLLFIGDGSLQMTVQAISDMIREKLNIIIFVINNDGYTIERCIHGRNQKYNDIPPWRYLLAPAFFGAEEQGEYAVRTYSIKTWGDLEHVLEDEDMKKGKVLRMVEIFMEREDAPATLLTLMDRQLEEERRNKATGV